ncbi:MAG: fibronectin type III domain-containing protein, partial [Deferribacteraceae bacterium]|nr:fibronectin type III domain-containing protein [Deferribacteraceae bacterium]
MIGFLEKPARKTFFPALFLKLALMVVLLFSVSCDSESKGDGGIPLTGPQTLTITSFDQALQVAWTKVVPAQAIDATYEVYYGETDDVTAAHLSTAGTNTNGSLVTTVIRELDNYKTYYVWVKARFGSLGESGFSPSAFGSPIAVPTVPLNLSVLGSDNSLEVAWDNVADAYTYEVAYGESNSLNSAAVIGDISAPGVIIPELVNGTSYYVWVRAVNTAGRSTYSSFEIGIPEITTVAPAVPVIIEARAGNKKVLLKWRAVSRATAYQICATATAVEPTDSDICKEFDPGIGEMAAAIDGLTNGTLYYIWLQAKNNIGPSGFGGYEEAVPATKPAINFNSPSFVIGYSTGEYIQAEDLPPSHFHVTGIAGKDRLSRRKETAIGNLYCDGAVWYAREIKSWTVDFAFLNGGLLSSIGLKKGDVTVASIASTVAYSNDYFTVVKMKGEHVKLLFDAAADVTHSGMGGSGTGAWGMVSKEIRYTIEYEIPPDDMSTPLPLDKSAYYRGNI